MKPIITIAAMLFGIAMASCSDDAPKLEYGLEPPLPDRDKAPEEVVNKPKAIWIDVDANFYTLATKAGIDKQLEKIKLYGFNTVIVDAKPSNGYAEYKSDILPYLTAFGTKTAERDYDDYLGYIISKCEELELDVIASVCAMGWGYKGHGIEQGFVYDNWDKWKDKVQVRSDSNNPNNVIPISEDPLQSCVMLDPTFPEVRSLVASVCGELAAKYPKLRGICLDYIRYCNNDGGWFGMSDRNMRDYQNYWNDTELPNHLEFVTATGGIGPKFARWVEYRSAMVTQCIKEIRDAVKAARPDCELQVWASAQWSSRYSVGQNWASKRYVPDKGPYTDTYSRTGFADLIDVFITGAYSEKVWISEDPSTEWTVENFVTTWDKYIMGDCKCWGSIAAYALDATKNTDATYLCLRHCDGFASFELSHVNNGNLWQSTRDGFKRYHGSWE